MPFYYVQTNNQYLIELFVFESNTWNLLTMQTNELKQLLQRKSYIQLAYKSPPNTHIYISNLALNNPQELICHKTPTNQVEAF